MKLAVCIEISSRMRTKDVLNALRRAHIPYINLGMTGDPKEPELTYIETSFISALFLNLKIVDIVIGGCGTGQGYLNAVMQYPNICAGLILDPVDAFLFSQINAGNVVSLALNKGYGTFGAEINLDYIFEKLFSTPAGGGYPEHRASSQKESRQRLVGISELTHYSMQEILKALPREFVLQCLNFPGILDHIVAAPNSALKDEVISLVTSDKIE